MTLSPRDSADDGALDLRPEILSGLMRVRDQHREVQALLHQVIRKVVLPRCRQIGMELEHIKGLYPKGKRGPGGAASRFYADVEEVTGLKKAQVANYVQIAKGWHRLVDYMADLPEGAEPITSMRGAMEALRSMNRRLPTASSSGVVDATATTVEVNPLAPAVPITANARKKVVPTLAGLRAVAGVSEKHRQQLSKIQEAVELLLDQIEMDLARQLRAEQGRPVPPPAQWESEAVEVNPALDRPIAAEYPDTAEGFHLMEQRIAEAGSGPRFYRAEAERLGVAYENVQKLWKRRHKKWSTSSTD